MLELDCQATSSNVGVNYGSVLGDTPFIVSVEAQTWLVSWPVSVSLWSIMCGWISGWMKSVCAGNELHVSEVSCCKNLRCT